MPWIRTDDSEYDSPRVVGVSLAAYGLLKYGQGWACRQLTDGWISETVIVARAGRANRALVSELVRVGLLRPEQCEGAPGWRIADDLVELQPKRVDVERDRAAARARQQRHRNSVTPTSRRDTTVTHAAVTPPSQDPVPSRPVHDEEQRADARDAFASFKEIREHLLSACHQKFDVEPEISDGDMADYLKAVAGKLRGVYTGRQITSVIDAVRARRLSLATPCLRRERQAS